MDRDHDYAPSDEGLPDSERRSGSQLAARGAESLWQFCNQQPSRRRVNKMAASYPYEDE